MHMHTTHNNQISERPNEIVLNNDQHGSVYDYSFMSSCSLPSDQESNSPASHHDRHGYHKLIKHKPIAMH